MEEASNRKVPLMVTVCQKCGDTGFAKDLIYCSQCQLFAEHRYCLDNAPIPDNEEVKWTCEQCAPSSTQQFSNLEVNSFPVRRSERRKPQIGLAANIFGDLNKRKGRLKSSVSKAKATLQSCDVKEAEARREQLLDKKRRGACIISSSPDEETAYDKTKQQVDQHAIGDHRNQPSCGVSGDGEQEPKKQQRRLTLEDGSSDEENTYNKAKQFQVDPDVADAPVGTSPHAQPVIYPAWRGHFEMMDEKFGLIVAHISSKACLKYSEEAKMLQPLLCMNLLTRLEAWPKCFNVSAPSAENISLFFFSENERDDNFDELVQRIKDQDVSLKAKTPTAELYVFSSLQLPQQHWSLSGRYYLWGVFKGRGFSS